MTDSAQALGSLPAQTGAAPSTPPIPPPASVGGAQGSFGYSATHEEAAVAWLSPRGHRALWLAAGAAAVVVVALLLAGVFKSPAALEVTTIQAPPVSAAASAQAQAGLEQPGRVSVTGQAPFVLHYPKGWARLTAVQLAKITNPPAAGLIADGGKALLLVRPKKPLTQPLSTLSTQLTRSLSASFTDFELLSTGTITTLAGPAWVYTFERSKHGLVQTEVVVSTNSVAYEIDIALRGGADRAARQIGEIVHSFQT
jgi:hypothetical protein